jgi:hypothetical protein
MQVTGGKMRTDEPGATTIEGGANRFLDRASMTAHLDEEASTYIPGGTSRIHYHHFRPSSSRSSGAAPSWSHLGPRRCIPQPDLRQLC